MAATLRLVLGDQLDRTGPALRDVSPDDDVIVMAEVTAEIDRYPSHKQRVVLFLSAMRHLRNDLVEQGHTVDYQRLEDPDPAASLPDALSRAVRRHQPDRVVVARPGRWELQQQLSQACSALNVAFEVMEDDHFLVTPAEFAEWAEGRKRLTMEHFYRMMRKRLGVLLADSGEPEGGRWNYDEENREAFSFEPEPPDPRRFQPDEVTRGVIEIVERRFDQLPGSTGSFGWPVTPSQAEQALESFVSERLADFGRYQDAMWTSAPFLHHSLLSPALNLKLISPGKVVREVTRAYREGAAPLNAAEGFIRQVIGWREFIRGVYWLKMPDLISRNELCHEEQLPPLYWTGETDMACLRDTVGQLLQHGYAHHIQRLMVAGLFALLYGVRPSEVHDWFMALYVDSVEWVTLPNTVGMSQFADGGIVGTKPYVASGRYLERQSNYCAGCRFDPGEATGDSACPFTTLYWEFLDRHRKLLAGNHRMGFQLGNLSRKPDDEIQEIKRRAGDLRRLARTGDL